MIEIMDKELKIAESEYQEYEKHLHKLEQQPERPNVVELEKELAELQASEKTGWSEGGRVQSAC